MNTAYLQTLFGLTGKVAVVTGASRGLGQAIAIGLAQAGATVVAVGSKIENLTETVARLTALGAPHLAVPCDQREPQQITHTLDAVLEKFGRIDILINNAGTIRRAPAADYSDDDWAEVIETNLNGVFRFCRGA